MNLETIIGLEIHIQMKTKSKMFCSCSNDGENQLPNTTICPICLGHPGTLPVANQRAVEFGVMMALGLNCQINRTSIWARKNYFYPDLPKGYQISQFNKPLAVEGHLTVLVNGEEKRFSMERLHLEEDAAKNFHSQDATLVDYNRGGTPLMEIVTKPDFRTPEGEDSLYPKTEIKNLNSFKAVEKALTYEIKRQSDLWNLGTPPMKQSTRGWDEHRLETVEQRDKEESADYRYFS